MVIEFYTKEILYFCCGPILYFFHPVLSKCLFCCKNKCVLKLRDDLFKADGIMFLFFFTFPSSVNHLKDCRGRESEASPWIREGAVAGCIRMYWRRNFAVLILSFAVLWMVKMCYIYLCYELDASIKKRYLSVQLLSAWCLCPEH